MKNFAEITAVFLLLGFLALFSACGGKVEIAPTEAKIAPSIVTEKKPETSPVPQIPNLQTELLDDRNKTTNAAIGKFDFKNFTYKLPRGWQDADGKEAVLENGLRRTTEEKIGLLYITTKFFDVTSDGQDEAVVILKINTGGGAIPQIVYIFEWKADAPNLIWQFRTGDRADGGLKDVRAENGEIIVELYGQDRFILGEVETSKITGDIEQLCCPTHFSQSRYKWNGKHFLMQGKRLTFSMSDKTEPPIENKVEVMEKESKR